TTDGGGTWTDISVDGLNNGPHTDEHALAVDSLGRILDGNDGGVWRYDPNGNGGKGAWTDLNGNLAITQFNGVASNPTDPTAAFGGARFNGNDPFANNLAWALNNAGDGGQVHIDPNDPSNVYQVQGATTLRPESANLMKSTTGGTAGSWSALPLLGAPFS